MSADPNLTAEHEGDRALIVEPNPVSTLGHWVAELANDVSAILATCEQLAPGAPLRAPLRAGLRHLVHIYPLAEGIEGLAMLEVALVLRVTALLAQPAEELNDETVLRLRAETGLIEELFPQESAALWALCARLIEHEMALESSDVQPEVKGTEGDDPLIERARAWGIGYVPPVFGGRAQELTRVGAFVKNRALSWST